MGRRQRPFFLGFLNGFAFTLGRRRHWVRARPVEDAVSQANTSVGRIDERWKRRRPAIIAQGHGPQVKPGFIGRCDLRAQLLEDPHSFVESLRMVNEQIQPVMRDLVGGQERPEKWNAQQRRIRLDDCICFLHGRTETPPDVVRRHREHTRFVGIKELQLRANRLDL